MVTYFLALLLALVQESKAPSVLSVTSLGASSDGTRSAATTDAFRRAFANNSKGDIIVPPGTYLIDNSDGPLRINNFGGQLTFQEAAQLVFTDNTKGGLEFVGGSDAIITGLRATYVTPPTVRKSPNEEIKFSGTVNTVLTDTVIRDSPAAGILFYDSINPSVTNAKVFNSLADGLNFSNCQNARVTNLLTDNTGDDGLAFVNYASFPNLTGGLAENVVVANSKARGIAVAGQSNVTVNGFQIQNTSSSGVLVAQDTASNTRIPANVFIENGTISNAGTLAPLVGNQYGIEFNSQESATFTNIAVLKPGNNGLSGTAPNGSVVVSNVSVNSPSQGLGFLFYQTRDVQITDSTAQNTPSYGFLSLKSTQVLVTGLTITNAGGTDPLKRAVWFEDANVILASSIHIVSAAGMANVIGCHTSAGYSASSGSVKTINFHMSGGGRPFSVENGCPAVNFTP